MKQERQGRIKTDIHNFDRRIESVTGRLERELTAENLALVKQYHNAIIIDTAGKAVQEKHLQVILVLTRTYQKSWSKITRSDVDDLVIAITKKYSDEKGQETYTSFDYKKILKIFVRWIKTGNRRKDPEVLDPIEIKGIRLKRVKDRLSRENLITETDINKLIHACGENIRDKAFISVHSEAGTRIGETLTLQIKHVVIDTYGAVIKVDGKTNARPIRLIKSLPHLAAWLDAHPLRADPDAPLWINLSYHGYGGQITYEGMKRILEKRAKIAGLEKRIFFHLFRHSEITETANYLTEAQLRKRHGWSNDSRTPGRYVHLVNADVEDAVLSHYGIVKGNKQGPAIPKTCSTCNKANSPESTSCANCGRPLDLSVALELDERQRDKDLKIEEQELKIASLEKQMSKLWEEWQSRVTITSGEVKDPRMDHSGVYFPVKLQIPIQKKSRESGS